MNTNKVDRRGARFDGENPPFDTRAHRRSASRPAGSSDLNRRRLPERSAVDFATGMEHWVKGVVDRLPDSANAVPRRALTRRSSLPEAKYQSVAWNATNGGDQEELRSVRAKVPVKEYRTEAARRIFKAKDRKYEVLDMVDLGLRGLPEQIGDLTKLETLDVSFNRLESLPDTIGNLAALKDFNAGVNEIQQLPSRIFELDKMVHFDVSGNQLENLTGVGQMVNLTRLHVDSNRITVLPAELGRLGKLKTFTAGMNLFASVPPEMGNLRELRRVNLSNTQIATLPPTWNPVIERLVHLDLSRTNFSGFYEDKNRDTNLKLPGQMQLLNLSFTKVKTLPESFGSLTFWGDASNNVLSTTNKSIFSKEMKIFVEQTNLPTELNRERRMATTQPIPKLAPLRHEHRRPPTENQDNDLDSGTDDGDDLEYELEFVGPAGAANLAHAERMRAAAANKLPRGRAADWAAECAAREFADPWTTAPPLPITANPWGDQPVAPWPGLSSPASMLPQLPAWAASSMPPQGGYGWLSAQPPAVNPMAYSGGPRWMMGAEQSNPFGFMQAPGGTPPTMAPYGSYGFVAPPGAMPAAAPQYNPYAFAQNPGALPPLAAMSPPIAMQEPPRQPAGPAAQRLAWPATQRPAWAPQQTLTERMGVQGVVDQFKSLYNQDWV